MKKLYVLGILFLVQFISSCSKISKELVYETTSKLGPIDPGPTNELNFCTNLLSGNTFNQRNLVSYDVLTGVITQEIKDYRDGRTEINQFLLTDSGEILKLDLSKLTADVYFNYNKRVTVKVPLGLVLRGINESVPVLDVEQIEKDDHSSGEFQKNTNARTYSFLTILVSFLNLNTKAMITEQQLTQKMNEVKQHYETATEGKTIIELDNDKNGIVDYVKVDLPINFIKQSSAGSGGSAHCTNAFYRQEVINKLSAELRRKYTNFAVVIQQNPDLDSSSNPNSYLCGFSVANLPGPDTLMTFMLSSANVTIHEIGHNFNLWHARADLDQNGSYTSGQAEEYGDLSCIMGLTSLPTHLGATSSMVMGAFQGKESSMNEITQGGNFSLSPLADLSNNSHPKILRFPISSTTAEFMNIVYRTRTGLDTNIKANPPSPFFPEYTGINIHLEKYSSQNGYISQQGFLLRNLANINDQFIFNHSSTGRTVTVKLLNKSDSSAGVNVALNFSPPPTCLRGHAEPRITSVNILDKKKARINFRIVNTDSYSCTPSSFTTNAVGDFHDLQPIVTSIVAKGISHQEIEVTLLGTQEFQVNQTYQGDLQVEGQFGTKSQAFKFQVIDCP